MLRINIEPPKKVSEDRAREISDNVNPKLIDFTPVLGVKRYRDRNLPTERNLEEYSFAQGVAVIANTVGLYVMNVAYAGLVVGCLYRGLEAVLN